MRNGTSPASASGSDSETRGYVVEEIVAEQTGFEADGADPRGPEGQAEVPEWGLGKSRCLPKQNFGGLRG